MPRLAQVGIQDNCCTHLGVLAAVLLILVVRQFDEEDLKKLHVKAVFLLLGWDHTARRRCAAAAWCLS